MFNKQIAFIFATALIVSPAAAADTTQANQAAANPAPKAKKYCIQEATTGTRMTNKVCKTKADWDKDGVDIDAETSKK